MNIDRNCPSCSTAVQPSTLRRYSGVCRRCFNQPKTERYCFIGFGAFAILAMIAAYLFDADIRAAEATGDAIRVHWIIAAAYNGMGLLGVRVLFALLLGLSSLLSLRSLVRWRRFSARNMRSTDAQFDPDGG